MNCPICGKPMPKTNKKACSYKCYGLLKQGYKTCVVCGKSFADPAANLTVTCSPACSHAHRQHLHKSGVYASATEKMLAAKSASPILQPNENHINARSWIIQSPGGEIFKCRNLRHWLRQHESMLDGTVQQAWDGISKIKYGMQGKRKNPNHQSKGWRLLEWGD